MTCGGALTAEMATDHVARQVFDLRIACCICGRRPWCEWSGRCTPRVR